MLSNFKTALAVGTAIALIAGSIAAWAGAGTITVKDSAGSTQTYVVVTDGSGHYVGVNVLCDYSAAANCATVNSSHQLAIAAASGSIASGALASGSIASGALASGSIASGAMVDLLTFQGTKAAGTAAANSLLAGGVYNSSPLTLTNGQQSSLQFDASGYLKTNVTNTNANGQTTMSASSPVTIASDQTAGDPCMYAAKTNVAIAMTSSTTIKLVSLSASKKIYICSLSLIASGATTVSIADGTKSSTECDTAAEAVLGATTTSHGMAIPANGGLTFGNGNGTVAMTNTAAHDLCLFQSGSVDLSGNITYVQRVP
jgi:hypothetical protein